MKKGHVLLIAIGVSLILATALTTLMFFLNVFHNYTDHVNFGYLISFFVFSTVFFFTICSVTFSNRFASGLFQEILFIFSSLLLISIILSYLVFALVDCGFEFMLVDWLGSMGRMPASWNFYLILGGVFIGLFLLYAFLINKNFFSTLMGNKKGELKQVKGSNLENSR